MVCLRDTISDSLDVHRKTLPNCVTRIKFPGTAGERTKLSKNTDQNASSNRRSDDARDIGSHSVHEQEI